MSNTIRQGRSKKKKIYKAIDSISGVAVNFLLWMNMTKWWLQWGARNHIHLFEQTVYTDDVPSSSLDKYLAVQSERFRNPVFKNFSYWIRGGMKKKDHLIAMVAKYSKSYLLLFKKA
jgi:hypothetical protein